MEKQKSSRPSLQKSHPGVGPEPQLQNIPQGDQSSPESQTSPRAFPPPTKHPYPIHSLIARGAYSTVGLRQEASLVDVKISLTVSFPFPIQRSQLRQERLMKFSSRNPFSRGSEPAWQLASHSTTEKRSALGRSVETKQSQGSSHSVSQPQTTVKSSGAPSHPQHSLTQQRSRDTQR